MVVMEKPKTTQINRFILFDRMKDGSIANIAISDEIKGLETTKKNREQFYEGRILANNGIANEGIASIEIKPCKIIIEDEQ
jgi:hypothetical protein